MSTQFIDQTARAELSQAVWEGRRRRVARWLTRKSNRLLSFGEFCANLQGKGRHYVGLRTVPVSNIVGSVGRAQEFDRSFAAAPGPRSGALGSGGESILRKR